MKQDQTRLIILLLFGGMLFCASCGGDEDDAKVPNKDSDSGEAGTDSTAAFRCEGPITFPDAALEAAVRNSINLIEGDISPEDVEELKILTGDDQGISDLTGIECLVNLEQAILYGNNIKDISALSGLTALEEIELGGNMISDISALGGKDNLNFLQLSNNRISHIPALKGLTALETIYLSWNRISDISGLSRLENLSYLLLNGNQVSDISALRGLENLSYIDLYDNQVSDISALRGLKNLSGLNLTKNEIEDISPLVEKGGLGQDDGISIRANPLDCFDPATREAIQTLEARGVDVDHDC